MEAVTLAIVMLHGDVGKQDKYMMYTVGSVFYGIYFYVGFPMFYRIDEDPKERWSWTRSAIDRCDRFPYLSQNKVIDHAFSFYVQSGRFHAGFRLPRFGEIDRWKYARPALAELTNSQHKL